MSEEELKTANIDFINDFENIVGIISLNKVDRRESAIPGLNLSGCGYFEGQSYENKDDVKYTNIVYKLVHTASNKIIDVCKSIDGSFRFDDLNPTELFSIIVLDSSSKYMGKYLDGALPHIDYQKAISTNRIYQSNGVDLIKIKFNGDPTKLIVSTDYNASITKIDDNNYKINNIIGNYMLTVKDYVDGVEYIKEKRYTQN